MSEPTNETTFTTVEISRVFEAMGSMQALIGAWEPGWPVETREAVRKAMRLVKVRPRADLAGGMAITVNAFAIDLDPTCDLCVNCHERPWGYGYCGDECQECAAMGEQEGDRK